ncbi:unnamed protein product [Medioppia subpectinata]|uniref:Uncharacterized protein n=1 Tax=Medioppia subpectinata TaxID=1979941 RepID=A0A7R9Q1X0_9ACAR|nr:unnamed protein product [Medioppia subpectinata]CAG2108840.1 unnamed protein product [Medioppia subpectinata]
MDISGNEWFYGAGTVVEGQCMGALIFVQNDVYNRNGSCDRSTGVMDVMSDVNQAFINMRGQSCATRCNGTVWFRYRPGKTSN